MRRRVLLIPAVLATCLAAPGAAAAADPGARATGVDAPPPLPSLVQTRLTRVEGALERLTEDVNEVDGAHAVKAGKTVRRQLAAAWRGARYYIVHAPPPPAEDARVAHDQGGVRLRDLAPTVRARISQDDEAPVVADPVATAMAVFDTFHDVSSTVIELTDGARVPVLDAMSRTLFLSLDRRDRAIADVHTLAPPVDEEADLQANAAQDEEAATFDATMPTIPVFLDDEVLHIDGLISDATDLRPGGTRILTKARAQILATEATINTFWPLDVED